MLAKTLCQFFIRIVLSREAFATMGSEEVSSGPFIMGPLDCQFYKICMTERPGVWEILDSHRGIVVDGRSSGVVHVVRL